MMTLYVIFFVLLALIITWKLLPSDTFGTVTGYMKKLSTESLDDKDRKRFNAAGGGIAAWLVFLGTLWLLSDMLPFWSWLTGNWKYFLALNVWLLAVALFWGSSGWARFVLGLAGFVLFFVALVAALAAAWEKFENWRAESKATAAIQQAAVAPPAPQKTIKRIVAPASDKEMKNLSEWVALPPYHRFVLECNAHVWIIPEGGRARLTDCSPGSFGENFPTRFRFQSASEREVPVTVSYWPERK